MEDASGPDRTGSGVVRGLADSFVPAAPTCLTKNFIEI